MIRVAQMASVIALALARIAFASDTTPPLSFERTLTIRPGPKIARYQFIPQGVSDYRIDSIRIFKVSRAQKILVQTAGGPFSIPGQGNFVWRIEDLNFDAWLDVGLQSARGATGNTAFNYWLFNPNTGRFDSHEELGSLHNIEVDGKRAVLRSHETHRMGYDEFKLIRGKLTRVKHVSNEAANEYNRTYHEWSDAFTAIVKSDLNAGVLKPTLLAKHALEETREEENAMRDAMEECAVSPAEIERRITAERKILLDRLLEQFRDNAQR
jgi:hypothetical protein